MRNIVEISAHNASHALYLTPEMAFFATECVSSVLDRTAQIIHKKQITTHSYARFANLVTDLYYDGEGGLVDQMVTCAALATIYNGLSQWVHSALQVAVSIHLNTIGVEDRSRYPRVVPHQLAAMRITDPRQIDQDLLWHILVTEPWITYAERSRAQLARMARVLGPSGKIDTMPETMAALAVDPTPENNGDILKTYKAAKRSIKRGYKLHTRLFGSENLRRLLKQKHLKLNGCQYDYDLTISGGDLFNYTMVRDSFTCPIHITVLRKDMGILCSLCLYFQDAPFIDHLVAITCHLKNPYMELELLKAAQVQSATRLFYGDPLLPDLKGLHDPAVAPLSVIENVALNAQYDMDNVPLRDSFYHFKWTRLARDLIGYPEDLIKIFWHGSHRSVWDFLDHTPDAKPVMDEAKDFFRTRFANTG